MRRRVVAGSLAFSSVATSQTAIRFLSSADLVDVGITLSVVTVSTFAEGVVGLQISWVFLGYLVYELVPKLYPDELQRLSTAPGFRVITAVLAVYFGLAVTISLGLLPPQTAFTLVTEWLLLGGLWRGILVGTLLFSVYLAVICDEHSYDVDGLVFQAYSIFDTYSSERIAAEKRHIGAIQALDSRKRRIVFGLYDLFSGIIFVVPCLGIGFVLGVISLYYPLPEVLFVFGVVVSVLPGERIDRARTTIESNLVRNVVDSTRNFKGWMMVFASALGVGFSAHVLLDNVGLTANILNQLVHIVTSAPLGTGRMLGEAGMSLVRVGALGAVLLTPPLYGLVGLLYWSRQLSRNSAYVRLWEAKNYDVALQEPSPKLPIRPPLGLFLTNSMLLLASAFVWQSLDGGLPFIVHVGFVVLWYYLFVMLFNSVRYSFRGESQPTEEEDDHLTQPIEDDGDAVFMAVFGQAVSVGIAGGLVNGYLSSLTSRYPGDFVLVAGVLVGLILVMFFAMAYLWELPDQLAESATEEQSYSKMSLEVFVGGAVFLFCYFFAAVVIGFASPLDVGLYIIVVAYAALLWYIENRVSPDPGIPDDGDG